MLLYITRDEIRMDKSYKINIYESILTKLHSEVRGIQDNILLYKSTVDLISSIPSFDWVGDGRWGDDQDDRARHHHSHKEDPDLFDLLGQPTWSSHPSL